MFLIQSIITTPADRVSAGFTRRILAMLVLSLNLGMAAVAHAEEEASLFPGLRALMNDEQFERSGLDKLSPKERAALNRWLAAHAEFDLSVVTAPAKPTQRAEKTGSTGPDARPAPPEKVVAKRIDRKKRAAREVIRTRIAGEFSGWSGSTIFSLENGQLWRQRQSGRYRYRADSPEVELFQNRLGLWEMRVLATGKRVKISRYYQ